jgi:hypothetical protein
VSSCANLHIYFSLCETAAHKITILSYRHANTHTHTVHGGQVEQRAPVISFWCCTRHYAYRGKKHSSSQRAESWIIIFALCSFMHIAHLSLFFPLRRVRVCILNSLVYTCFTYCKEPFVSEWVSERARERTLILFCRVRDLRFISFYCSLSAILPALDF